MNKKFQFAVYLIMGNLFEPPTKNYSYEEYEFYMLTDLDVDIIRNSYDGERVLHRNKGQLPLLWVLKPRNTDIANISEMEHGIL